MSLGRLRARTLRERVVLLLLPALAFRLLFPAGFMPRFGDDLELSMQMCHGDGKSSAIIRVLDDTPAAPGDDRGRHEAPCVFAAVSAFAAPAPAPAALEVATPDAVPPAPRAPAPALRVTHRSQAPRAPPLMV
jgi:hypothetical protein